MGTQTGEIPESRSEDRAKDKESADKGFEGNDCGKESTWNKRNEKPDQRVEEKKGSVDEAEIRKKKD